MEKRLVPFTSILLQDMVSTSEMRKIWFEENMVNKWINVEKSITKARTISPQ